VAQPGSNGPFWEYSLPSGFTLVGGQITAVFQIPGASVLGYSAATGMLGPKLQFDSADVIGGRPAGEIGASEATLSLAGHTGGHIWLYAFCEPAGGTCPANGSSSWYWSATDMLQATLLLENDEGPAAGSVTGPVSEAGPLSGTESLSFSATDPASGVYRVQASLDGQSIYSGTPNTNHGECAPVGTYAGVPEFVSASPCPHSVSASIPVNTTSVHDGRHELVVTVEDAAGNETTLYTRQIETRNAPVVVSAPLITGSAAVGATLTATPATFQAPVGAGTLGPVSGQWVRCTDPLGEHCSTIPTATGVTYTPQASDAGYYMAYVSTASDSDGTTSSRSAPTTAVPAPSTTSGSGSTSSSSGGGLVLNINGTTVTTTRLLGSGAKWAISLKGSPLRVRKGTRIVLTGVVSTSPRPAAGKLVELEARSVFHRWVLRRGKFARIAVYGGWARFGKGEIRTGQAGQWHAEYVMKYAGHYTYQMRAVAPREGGFRNPTGVSNIITITET